MVLMTRRTFTINGNYRLPPDFMHCSDDILQVTDVCEVYARWGGGIGTSARLPRVFLLHFFHTFSWVQFLETEKEGETEERSLEGRIDDGWVVILFYFLVAASSTDRRRKTQVPNS